MQTAVSEHWFDWPALPDLFPVSFPGVETSRDGFLVDVDLDRLKARLADYFNTDVSHEEIARRYPGVMKTTARFDARAIRDALLARGGPTEDGFVRFSYRPFDNRWLYWESETKLLDEKRADYRPHVFKGNRWLVLQNKARPDLSPPLAISHIGDLNQMNSGVYCVPGWLSSSGLQRRPNLSGAAQSYLERLGASVENLFHHAAVRIRTHHRQLPDGKRLLLVEVPEGDSQHDSQGGSYIRVGGSKQKMTSDERLRLAQRRGQARFRSFDEQTVPDTGFGTLDEWLWKPLLTAEGAADPESALGKLALLKPDEAGIPRATIAGVLLCTRNPEQWLPNACITATRYRGKERASGQIDAQEITGPLNRQIADAVAFAVRNMHVAARKEPARVDLPQYSDKALSRPWSTPWCIATIQCTAAEFACRCSKTAWRFSRPARCQTT